MEDEVGLEGKVVKMDGGVRGGSWCKSGQVKSIPTE